MSPRIESPASDTLGHLGVEHRGASGGGPDRKVRATVVPPPASFGKALVLSPELRAWSTQRPPSSPGQAAARSLVPHTALPGLRPRSDSQAKDLSATAPPAPPFRPVLGSQSRRQSTAQGAYTVAVPVRLPARPGVGGQRKTPHWPRCGCFFSRRSQSPSRSAHQTPDRPVSESVPDCVLMPKTTSPNRKHEQRKAKQTVCLSAMTL